MDRSRVTSSRPRQPISAGDGARQAPRTRGARPGAFEVRYGGGTYCGYEPPGRTTRGLAGASFYGRKHNAGCRNARLREERRAQAQRRMRLKFA